jgi:hypothetical protein
MTQENWVRRWLTLIEMLLPVTYVIMKNDNFVVVSQTGGE